MRKTTRGMGYWASGMWPGGVKGGRLCCRASHSTLSKAMYGRRMWRSCQRSFFSFWIWAQRQSRYWVKDREMGSETLTTSWETDTHTASFWQGHHKSYKKKHISRQRPRLPYLSFVCCLSASNYTWTVFFSHCHNTSQGEVYNQLDQSRYCTNCSYEKAGLWVLARNFNIFRGTNRQFRQVRRETHRSWRWLAGKHLFLTFFIITTQLKDIMTESEGITGHNSSFLNNKKGDM